MPGITGIIGSPSPDAAALQAMVQCMDRESFYVSGTCNADRLGLQAGWVCHRNSFSDCMPVWNEAKTVCLIFFGQDFSDPGDIQKLKALGHRVEAANASYLVHLYEEQGPRFLEQLNGWFCGVIADFREQKVVLFNDRYGLGRVYVHEDNGVAHFSSEAKSLLKVLPVARQFDVAGLADDLACGCALQDRTLFAGVSLLPAGSCWTFARGQSVRKEIYFDKAAWENLPVLGDAEYYDKLKATFARILPRYFRGTDPIGMSLTGGLDGRMIMAWAGREPGTLPCYTFGGSYRECSDVTIAREVARTCRQPHQIIPVNGDFLADFAGSAEKAVYISDGAMDITGSVELFANQRARQIAPVRLTGNYGSEILRGNVAFKAQPLNPSLFAPDLVKLGDAAAAMYAREAQGHPVSFIAFKQVPWHHHSRLSVEQSQLTLRAPYLDNDLVALVYQASRAQLLSKEPSLQLIAEGHPALSRIPTNSGLVYRPVPGLTRVQHAYQEFTFKAEYAYDYGMPQWLARIDHALSPLRLERVFLGRHKFYHFRVWYRDTLRGFVRALLLDPRTRQRPFLQGARLESLVADHTRGRRNYTTELHQALTIELIYRTLIEQN